MTLRLFIILFFFAAPNIGVGQNSCRYPIKWAELKLHVSPEVIPVVDTMKTDTGMVVYRITTCMGQGSFTQYDTEGKRTLTGNYEESLGLLGFHQPMLDLETGKLVEYALRQYYEGLKSGKWVYYDNGGKVTRTETYERGVIVEY